MRANTHLIYGESGTFKTTQVGFFAEYIWRKFHKRTRLVSADGGGWFPIQKYVDAGIIEPYGVSGLILKLKANAEGEIKHESPLAVLRLLSKGYWPKVKDQKTAALEPTTAKEWEEIGAYAVEGYTSIGDLLMEELRLDQRKVAEDAVSAFSITVDGQTEKFSANNRAHYNFVQNEVHGLVRAFSGLPVHNVLFTAHEGKGEDEATREAIRGPAIVGKAATAKVPSWVGDCIHADSYTIRTEVVDPVTKFKSVQLGTKVRMWFVRHPDDLFNNISYPAKLRVDSSQVPEVMRRWSGGYFEPDLTGGIDRLLALEDELTEKAATELIAKLQIGQKAA